MLMTDDRPGIEESYQVATGASNLRVELDRRSTADILIAAGMSPYGVGTAAIRLRGEWDRSEKPRLMAKIEAQKLAAQEGPSVVARVYEQELRLLSQKLKSFGAVVEPMALFMKDRAGAVQVLLWWLNQNCPKCGGTKWQTVSGTNRHGAKLCKPCDGTGISRVPCDQLGRRAANLLDDSVQIARTAIKKRLR